MSRFNVTLVIGFSFFVSPLLIGMKKEQATFEYSNPYFDPELQKALTLIMLKNRNQKEVNDLDRDILMIIAKKSIALQWKALLEDDYEGDLFTFRFVKFPARMAQLDRINNPERIKDFKGELIGDNNFDFLTMNEVGRTIFKHTLDAISSKLKLDGSYVHRYAISPNFYKKTLKLPLRLRCKIGLLCTLKVVQQGFLPLVPEDAVALKLKEIQEMSQHLPMQLKEKVKLARINLKNRE